MSMVSKLPMRQLTLTLISNLPISFSKLPMRQLTKGSELGFDGEFSKLPMRQLTMRRGEVLGLRCF